MLNMNIENNSEFYLPYTKVQTMHLEIKERNL